MVTVAKTGVTLFWCRKLERNRFSTPAHCGRPGPSVSVCSAGLYYITGVLHREHLQPHLIRSDEILPKLFFVFTKVSVSAFHRMKLLYLINTLDCNLSVEFNSVRVYSSTRAGCRSSATTTWTSASSCTWTRSSSTSRRLSNCSVGLRAMRGRGREKSSSSKRNLPR